MFGPCSDTSCRLIASNSGTAFVSTDGGLSWKRDAAFVAEPRRVCVETRNGVCVKYQFENQYGSTHGSAIAKLKPPAAAVRDATEDPARGRSWTVLTNGGFFGVENNDRWIPVTRTTAAMLPGHQPLDAAQRYGRFPAPWYLLLLAVCGFVIVAERESAVAPADEGDLKPGDQVAGEQSSVGRDDADAIGESSVVPNRASQTSARETSRSSATARTDQPAIGEQGTADKPLSPGEPDALGLGVIATGLAFFFRNQKTKPPLVLAINGRWGSGKSSLMNLLRARLADYGACPVWFNAWHHQQEDQLLAALLEAVRAQSIPSLSSWSGWSLRFRLAARRLQQSSIQLALVFGAIVVLWQVERDLKAKDLSIGIAADRGISWAFGARPESPDRSALLRDAAQMRQTALTAPEPRAKQLRTMADELDGRALARTEAGTAFPKPADLFGDTSVLALLAALFAAFKAASKGLRAFASNPASLLATESGTSNPKDLEAQANFRQRFASEFADVTGVLGPNRRMTILIDDLDRCRPEKVREVLEAVNFLCSSGQCFIVLGMARDIVEHCVGLSFRRVVDTMPWEAFDLSAEEIERFVARARGTSKTPVSDVRANLTAKRLAFARLFLDKLIQIEVAIPQPTPLQKLKLFETDEERRSRRAAEVRVSEWLERIRSATKLIAPVVQAAVLVMVVVGGGLELGRMFGPMLQKSLAAPTQQASEASPPSTVAATLTTANGPPADARPAEPAPEVRAAATATPNELLSAWPFYVVLLYGFAATAMRLRRLPHQTVRDAKPFSNALGVWHPLVMTDGARNTPRTARRFQNRVRYLAMRQRALVAGAPIAVVERWIRSALDAPSAAPEPLLELPNELMGSPEFERDLVQIADWLIRGAEGECALAVVKQSPEGPKVVIRTGSMSDTALCSLAMGQIWIPEPILVALAAIDELAPEWIDDAGTFTEAIRNAKPGAATNDLRLAAVSEAVARHATHWDNWHNLSHYRRAYLRLCSELDDVKSPGRPRKNAR